MPIKMRQTNQIRFCEISEFQNLYTALVIAKQKKISTRFAFFYDFLTNGGFGYKKVPHEKSDL